MSASEQTPRSLLDWLLQRYPDTPKVRAKQWILAGRVSVNGEVIRKPQQQMPDPGSTLELLNRQAAALDCGTGWQIHPRLALLYLDSSLAVVNKGPGLLAVPAPNSELSALSLLADFLAGKLKAQDRGVAGRSLPPVYRQLQPLPVHRLDQYTSGVFCLALNPTARHHLIEQLKVHTMKREYIAFVRGRPRSHRGTWRNWLHLSKDQFRQHVVSDSVPESTESEASEAITHFEVLTEYPFARGRGTVTKLRLRLETGRKHQIRVQAANAGVPLIGDHTYHGRISGPNLPALLADFPRQALHAERLSLEHPEQLGRHMSWTAELPKDLRQLEAALRSGQI